MSNVYISAGIRTAIGKIGGGLSGTAPEELMSQVIKGLLTKQDLAPGAVDEVIVGQTKQSSDAPNIARVASLMAGLPEEVPAYTVHRQCSSGLQAILNGIWQIQAGYGQLILAGGVESMSLAPYYLRGARYGYRSGNSVLVDPNTESQPRSQPEDVYGCFTMGETAENLAKKYSLSRQEQDDFAYASQIKALRSIDAGLFAEEILPINVRSGKATVSFSVDEHPRRDVSLEKLARLEPAFMDGGTVTAGNCSGRNDGAAVLSVLSRQTAEKSGMKSLVRFVSAGIAGVDPRLMGIGPVTATRMALDRAQLGLKDIGLIELNEAFAAQSLAVIKELGMDPGLVNVNGGAIALGHPLGCSGTRIVVTLVHEMLRRKVRYGLATICVAGGMGVSMILENPSSGS